MSNPQEKPEQVLILDPSSELTFKGPFKDIVTSVLTLTNPLEKSVAFKVKTTAPRKYCVRPNNGVVKPNSSVDVSVMLQPFEYDPNEKNRHKFMVLSLIVDDDVTDFETAWKNGSGMMDSKLRCLFVMPKSATESEEPSKKLTAAKEPMLSFKTDNASQASPAAPAFSTPKPTAVSTSADAVPSLSATSSTTSFSAASDTFSTQVKPQPSSSPSAKSLSAEEEVRKLKADIIALKRQNEKLKEEGLRLRRSPADGASTAQSAQSQEISSKQDGISTIQLVIGVLLALMLGYILAKFII